jgi:iron(III) transport system substrate-binding protein
MTRKTFEEFPIASVFLGRHGRACPGHPCLGSGSKDVDARVKPAHDGGNAASRRDVLRASGAIFASGVLRGTGGFTQHARAQAVTVEPAAITPALVQAAGKEGKLAFYTAMDLPVAEKFGKAFEARYPGISVRVERSGAERVFQRIGQEMESRIHAVDVVNSADAAHFIVWKRNGWLDSYLPEEVARHYPAAFYDPDGLWVTTRVWLSSVGYNTNLVRPEDAPKSFADLLDTKWTGRMVKAHPAYSGTIMTATFQIVRELGWGYLEKLAKKKKCCRFNRRPIRQRSSRSANAPSWPTATITI